MRTYILGRYDRGFVVLQRLRPALIGHLVSAEVFRS